MEDQRVAKVNFHYDLYVAIKVDNANAGTAPSENNYHVFQKFVHGFISEQSGNKINMTVTIIRLWYDVEENGKA